MSADFGPAADWPVWWPCDVSMESPAATGQAVAAATDILWAMTGMRFGTTQVKLRPCRRICRDTPFPGNLADPWPGAWGLTSPWGALVTAGCAFCGDNCSCTVLSEIVLPAPVNSVVEVRTDGAVVATGSYRLDNNRILVRTDTYSWPYCQNLRLDDTQPGTFSVTALFGEDVPSGAAAAVGELACEFLRAWRGEDCRLPTNLTQLTRQGVSLTLPDLTTALRDKKTLGLRLCDLFVYAWNPAGIRDRARVYSVDAVAARRVGTG